MDFIQLLNKKCALIASNEDGLLAFEKAEGILSHPNSDADTSHSLFQDSYDNEEECYLIGNKKIYLLHRLDSPTSGILLCSTNKILSDQIKNAFEDKHIQKTYYAWVKGSPLPLKGIWKDRISKNQGPKGVRMSSNSSGLLAETQFSCIKSIFSSNIKLSLLKLMPLTGRTHQLRIQTQLHHCPIIGDQTYGDFSLNKVLSKTLKTKRLFLHAKSIKLKYSINGKEKTWEMNSELPQVFNFQ